MRGHKTDRFTSNPFGSGTICCEREDFFAGQTPEPGISQLIGRYHKKKRTAGDSPSLLENPRNIGAVLQAKWTSEHRKTA
ncbi:MAG: hypothetical protein WCG84_03105 [Candidatus Moraniibacteriota bacterium]